MSQVDEATQVLNQYVGKTAFIEYHLVQPDNSMKDGFFPTLENEAKLGSFKLSTDGNLLIEFSNGTSFYYSLGTNFKVRISPSNKRVTFDFPRGGAILVVCAEIPEVSGEVYHFLVAYFHQDIESVEVSFKEFVEENSPAVIEQTIASVKEFLMNKEMTDDAKNVFIENQTALNFPAMGSSPLEWLTKTIYKVERLFVESGKQS